MATRDRPVHVQVAQDFTDGIRQDQAQARQAHVRRLKATEQSKRVAAEQKARRAQRRGR